MAAEDEEPDLKEEDDQREEFEAKWWHVPDDHIEELVRRLAEDKKEASLENRASRRGKAPKPLRSAHWASIGKTETPKKLTPQDALDEMLKRMTVNKPKQKSSEEDPPDEFTSGDTEDGLRPSKGWHVSDRQIEEHIQKLSEESTHRQLARGGSSAMRSTIQFIDRSSPSRPPVSVESPKGIHVRLKALARSEPIPCHRTGRRHAAAPKGDHFINVFFHLMDNGLRFSLTVHPDLRIGPDQPPPGNIFTEKFGLGARTNGFELKAQSFDYRCKQWASNPRPNWVPSWTDNLKARIELATGVEVPRQRLLFHGSLIGADFTTLRVAGITHGNEIQVYAMKTDPSRDFRNTSGVVLASTAKRRETEEARHVLEQSRERVEASIRSALPLKSSPGDSPKRCLMPPWQSQEMPALFGGKDDGAGRCQTTIKPAVPSFEEVPIFHHDKESKLERVRSLPCYTLPAARW